MGASVLRKCIVGTVCNVHTHARARTHTHTQVAHTKATGSVFRVHPSGFLVHRPHGESAARKHFLRVKFKSRRWAVWVRFLSVIFSRALSECFCWATLEFGTLSFPYASYTTTHSYTCYTDDGLEA